MLEMITLDKHSSLLQTFVNDRQKSLLTLAPGSIIVIAYTGSCLGPGCSVLFDIAGAIWIAATSKHLGPMF